MKGFAMAAKTFPASAKDITKTNWAAIWDGAVLALDSFGHKATHEYPDCVLAKSHAAAFAGDWEKIGGDLFTAMLKYQKGQRSLHSRQVKAKVDA